MSEASVLASKLAAISNAFTLENRFKKNFDVMSQIGIGGFAKVNKAKNHLDEMEYAIKKIKIDTIDKSAYEVVNELDQILNEIRCFAKIKHKHIVRYNHSWIEVKLKEKNQTNQKSNDENKLSKNSIKANKKQKSQIKNNQKKSSKDSKAYEYLEIESSSDNSFNFTDKSYECEISWEGINKSDDFKSNEKENKKIKKQNKEIYSFDSSFYLEEDNNNLPFHCNNLNNIITNNNKKEKICAENDSEFSLFDFQAIGKIKKKKTINKKYALDEDCESHNDSENEINFVKSISRINKLSEDYNDELFHENRKRDENKNKKLRVATALLKNNSDEKLKVIINEKEYKFSQIAKFTIYLQMELCKQTLEDFLKEKAISRKFAESLKKNINTNQSTLKSQLENLEIFLEITKAINYLHESENIIHRDIKPQNIFFSFDGNVKLGDFGLATNFCNEKYSSEKENSNDRKNSAESKTTTLTRSSSPPTYSNTDINIKLNGNDNCTFFHTKNIGTLLYSAPEQLNENFYDYKSDIYSLGLVLFELMQPFKTQMEKNLKFEQIKKGKIPLNFLSEEPVIAKLVLAMCEIDTKKRPNCKEIMKVLLKEISSKYFLVLESNASENADFLSAKEIEYQNYFAASSKNLSVSTLSFSENADFNFNNNHKQLSNFLFPNENFVDLDLKKASIQETCDGKLNLLRNTLKFIKKTEDFCVDITNDRKNSRLFSVKDFQEIKTRKYEEEVISLNANANKTSTNSLNLHVEEIQSKRLRLLNSEIEANYNKENMNSNYNTLFGKGYLIESEYKTKKDSKWIGLKTIQLSEKNRVYVKIYENNLLLFQSPKPNKAYKVFDLLESQVKIKPNSKKNLTQITLDIPFYSSVCILLESSKENNEIIKKIKQENFLN